MKRYFFCTIAAVVLQLYIVLHLGSFLISSHPDLELLLHRLDLYVANISVLGGEKSYFSTVQGDFVHNPVCILVLCEALCWMDFLWLAPEVLNWPLSSSLLDLFVHMRLSVRSW